MNRGRQSGITLVIALVMLIVLSLLVVSAIRFGNINLKITGNVQSEAEAMVAAQLAVEKTIKTMIDTPNMSTVAAQPTLTVSAGGQDYSVNVAKPACLFNKNISNTELNPTDPKDLPCFEGADSEKIITSENKLTSTPTACKNQQWDVQASVNDARSGARTTVLQGVATRVGAEVQCP
ncbi:MAG TPA: PilX N-terminal domain-containing pilus assembly protein [Ramlibacter sp.]|uniref:pilus assembly PilX family protein n=1 Tax=Ramlibacter sp. TaxID=1917967 RepID=UPI002ED4B6D7